MKIKDSLDNRGIYYKELKENKQSFTVLFEDEEAKNKAIRAIVKDDCAVISDEGLKIKGLKKKALEPASDNSAFDIHAIDPHRLKKEILEDLK